MRPSKTKGTTRLQVERLEDRVVPSTLPNDQLFNRSYHHDLLQSREAWQLTTGDARVVVTDLDTGIDYTHPDLYKNVWLNQAEIPADVRANLIDTDADGIITFWDLNAPMNQGPNQEQGLAPCDP
jgi:subtilisin family serine protease